MKAAPQRIEGQDLDPCPGVVDLRTRGHLENTMAEEFHHLPAYQGQPLPVVNLAWYPMVTEV